MRIAEICERCGVLIMRAHVIGEKKYCERCNRECGDLLKERVTLCKEIERLRRQTGEPSPLEIEGEDDA